MKQRLGNGVTEIHREKRYSSAAHFPTILKARVFFKMITTFIHDVNAGMRSNPDKKRV